MSNSSCSAKRMSQSLEASLPRMLSMGTSKPATSFRGVAFPFSLYPPSFPVQSIRNRLGFLFPPEARASRRHNIPADDHSPSVNRTPIASRLPLVRALRAGGALAGFEPPGVSGANRDRPCRLFTVLTVPAKHRGP